MVKFFERMMVMKHFPNFSLKPDKLIDLTLKQRSYRLIIKTEGVT